jgi:hypothetical protein
LALITGVYSRQSLSAIRMFDAWQRATVSRVVIAAFHSIWLVPFEHDGAIDVKINVPMTPRITHWTEARCIEEIVSAADVRLLRWVDNTAQ